VFPGDDAVWTRLDDDEAAEVLPVWRPVLVSSSGRIEPIGLRARSLRFLPDCRLLRADFGDHPDGLGLFALETPNGLLELLGESAPIHKALEREAFRIADEGALIEYAEFFCFFVHGPQGPFRWVRNVAELNLTRAPSGDGGRPDEFPIRYDELSEEGLASLIQEPAVVAADAETEEERVRATIQYGDALFEAVFSVAEGGAMEMLEETSIIPDLPIDERALILPRTRNLSAIPDALPEPLSGQDGEEGGHSRRWIERWTVVRLIEMRLLAALRKTSPQPAFGLGSPTSSDADLLWSFSDWVARAGAFVLFECETPFCEEIVAEILSARGPPESVNANETPVDRIY